MMVRTAGLVVAAVFAGAAGQFIGRAEFRHRADVEQVDAQMVAYFLAHERRVRGQIDDGPRLERKKRAPINEYVPQWGGEVYGDGWSKSSFYQTNTQHVILGQNGIKVLVQEQHCRADERGIDVLDGAFGHVRDLEQDYASVGGQTTTK